MYRTKNAFQVVDRDELDFHGVLREGKFYSVNTLALSGWIISIKHLFVLIWPYFQFPLVLSSVLYQTC